MRDLKKMVEGGSGIEGPSGQRLTLGKLDVAETPGWTQGVVDFLGEAPGSRDTCHHLDDGQILTTTDAPAFPLVKVCGREVR